MKKEVRHFIGTRVTSGDMAAFEKLAVKTGFVKSTGKPNLSKWIESVLKKEIK